MNENEDTDITRSDIKNIIKHFYNWKAPGPDAISIGMIKAGGKILIEFMHKI